jgi:tetratricopeptide (TPR) repeat protein
LSVDVGDLFPAGKIEKMTGDRESAIVDFEIASHLSDHADAEYNLGELLIQEGRIDEALKVFQQSAKQRKDKNIYNALANVYFLKKDYPRAIEYWKILSDRDPQNPAYWHYLWIAYLHTGNQILANQAHEKEDSILKWQK